MSSAIYPMALLFTATLYTPLLKIPLIITGLVSTLNAMTPPNPRAKDEETRRYGEKGSTNDGVYRVLAKAFRVSH